MFYLAPTVSFCYEFNANVFLFVLNFMRKFFFSEFDAKGYFWSEFDAKVFFCYEFDGKVFFCYEFDAKDFLLVKNLIHPQTPHLGPRPQAPCLIESPLANWLSGITG